MKVLLVSRMHNGQLDQASLQSFYQLEQKIVEIDLFIALGDDGSFWLPLNILDKLSRVLVGKMDKEGADSPEDLTAEELASAIEGLAKDYDLVVAGKGHFMDQVIARSAALLGREPLLGISHIIDENTLQYQAYNNAVLKAVYSKAVPKIITLAAGGVTVDTATDLVEVIAGSSPKTKTVEIARTQLVKLKTPQSLGAEALEIEDSDLEGAQIIIGCGAGVDSIEGIRQVRELAELFGAALGASKMTIEAGYLPPTALIGQSGKTISPKIYLTLGISGSMHHLGAVQGADIIITVNTDSEAPIMRMSDYSLIGDVSEVLPKLTGLLKDWDNHHGN